MSPKPIPITRGKRPATVHLSVAAGAPVAFCGRTKVKFATVPEDRVTCSVCNHNALLAAERRTECQRQRQILQARREQQARTAYEIWAHRGLRGAPEAFEHLPEPMRQAWREVVEYFEDAIAREMQEAREARHV
jgi:hypothetical protein